MASGEAGNRARRLPGARPTEEVCPICGRASLASVQPFCSVRCADVDLGQWLTGRYAVAVPPDEDNDAEDGRTVAGHDIGR